MRERHGIFQHIDWWLVIIFMLLVFMGWLNIYAAVYDENHKSILDLEQRYGKQMIWISAAFLIALITLLIEGKFFSQFAYFIYGICILTLIAVVFSGKEISGSKSWFQFAGMALQPAEFAKVGTALAIARFMSSLDFSMKRVRNLIILASIILLPILLIVLQGDAGSAIVFLVFILVFYRAGMSEKIMLILVSIPILAIFALVINKFVLSGVIMAGAIAYYFFATKRKIQTLITVVIISVAASGFIFSMDYMVNHVLEPHQRTRINVLFGKENDLKGAGYNVNQSLIAIGSGGFAGKGFLQGTQTKYNFVPEQSTDFIFCTVGEEWGFLGSAVVVGLFLTLIIRIVLIAERQRSRFSKFYGYGVASIIFFHFAINISMALGLIPVIGIPLPFFSYGGSSLWAFTFLLFIFIRQDSYRYELL
ncbi:MAG TPA: rod shape-determining protein RodA [Bacteroidales bacterium]|nr:rod shape-determining protein RodA [Bacteroidales bacterium]